MRRLRALLRELGKSVKAGGGGGDVEEIPVAEEELDAEGYEEAAKRAAEMLEGEKEKKGKKRPMRKGEKHKKGVKKGTGKSE